MLLQRYFVPEGTDPFSMFEYEKHDVEIKHHVTGKVIFSMRGAEVPKHWSKNARDVLVSKYFRKAGVPKELGCAYSPKELKEKGIPQWLAPAKGQPGMVHTGGETSIRQVVHRMVGHWAFTGWCNGYFGKDEAVAKAFYDDMAYILLNQMAAPNSPQWFNTGLWWAYGITGPAQGHQYVDLSSDTKIIFMGDDRIDAVKQELMKFVQPSPNSYERVQAHACFILDVKDTLLGDQGIMDWYAREARIFKFGSGSGANVSKLRAEGESLTSGGKSSGMLSWVEVADRSAGAIKSGGTTRRAAKMVCLDMDHPDIEAFIGVKVKTEQKVAALKVGNDIVNKYAKAVWQAAQGLVVMEQKTGAALRSNEAVASAIRAAAHLGLPANYIDRAILLAEQGRSWNEFKMDLEYEGEAYTTVAFQNANHSVRIPSKFYTVCDRGDFWKQTWRTNGTEIAATSARDLEDQIAYAAWYCGDPGVQFDTIINDWNVTPLDARINASNPCSEHMRPDDTACNLASLNLMRFFKDGVFNVEAFTKAVHLYQIMLDITCTMAHLPDKHSAAAVYLYRDTGLGYANLGAMIMSMGLAYDSDEARGICGAITSLMHAQAHVTSGKLAAQMGAYPRFTVNRESHLRCVRNHIRAANVVFDTVAGGFEQLTVKPVPINWAYLSENSLADWNDRLWREAYQLGNDHGYRNAEMTVIAPTGTISIIMDCDTTGVEPMIGLSVYKVLAGGGSMTLAPAEAVINGLKTLGYGSESQKIAEDLAYGREFKFKYPEHERVFDTALPSPFSGRSIPWPAHVKMMAAAQSFISGAISKTVNMPYSATIDDIKQCYRMSHDLGVKAVAVYRDGCKLSQPLNVLNLNKQDEPEPALEKSQELPDRGDESVIEMTERVTAKIQELLEGAVKGGLASPIQSKVRVRLPSIRQPGISVSVGFGPGNLYVSTVRYEDGKLGEIWIEYSADSGLISAMIKQMCKLANVALQYGVPTEAVLKTMIESRFEPNGMVTGHPYIKSATSLVSLAGRIIAYHELGDTSVLNIQPDAKLSVAETAEVEGIIAADVHSESTAGLMNTVGVVITGEVCPNCGSHQLQPAGMGCKRCVRCGYSGSCG